MNRTRLLRVIENVIAQGETIRRESLAGKPHESPSTSWYPRIMSVLHVLGDRADPWKAAAATCPSESSTGSVEKLLGMLKAIHEAVDQGLVNDIEESTRSKTLNDLIDQALAHIDG